MAGGWTSKIANGARRVGDGLAQLATTRKRLAAKAASISFYERDDVLAASADAADLSTLETLLADAWMRPGDRVLDVGCGTGREALAFAERGLKVTGIDLSARSIACASARASSSSTPPDFVVASIETLAVANATYDAVFFASDVHASLDGRSARIESLRRAHDLVRSGGHVLFQATLRPARASSIALDAALVALSRLRGSAHERGDRIVRRENTVFLRHLFASDEEVIGELDDAGLVFVERRGEYVVAERRERSARTDPPPSWSREIALVMLALPCVELARRTLGPAPAVATLRERGAAAIRRDARGRARLARAIAACDRLLPLGKGGCYRRTLLEIALDAGAAEEPIFLGFSGPEGHAWLPRSSPGRRFQSVVEL